MFACEVLSYDDKSKAQQCFTLSVAVPEIVSVDAFRRIKVGRLAVNLFLHGILTRKLNKNSGCTYRSMCVDLD